MNDSMTWSDVDAALGPEPGVAFDRDIAPQGWRVVLRLRGSELWADDADCSEHMRQYGPKACRCVVWAHGRWMSLFAFERRLRNEALNRLLAEAYVMLRGES